MKSRLDEIDQTMLQVKNVVHDASAKSCSINQDASSMAMLMTDQAMEGVRHHNIGDQSPQATSHHLVNDQHYGTSSLASLFNEIENMLETRFGDGRKDTANSNETLRECQSALHKMARTMMYHDSLDLPSEDLPPTLPPKDVLDAVVDTYFGQVNSMLPVFKKDSFCENINRIYDGGLDKADSAWILCFNNIILQTLSTDSVDFLSPVDDRGARTQSESAEAELLRPLVVNYRRGLKKLDCLLEPKLINIQALLSMVSESVYYWMVSASIDMSPPIVYNCAGKFSLPPCITLATPSMLRR